MCQENTLVIANTLFQQQGASLVAQRLKHLRAMWETWVRFLGREDPLEKEMATHSSILAWRIPWMEELGGLQSTGHKELDTTERLHFHFSFFNNTKDSFTHGYHQMFNTKIKLITFFVDKDVGEAAYSQQKQDLELTVAQIISFSQQIQA